MASVLKQRKIQQIKQALIDQKAKQADAHKPDKSSQKDLQNTQAVFHRMVMGTLIFVLINCFDPDWNNGELFRYTGDQNIHFILKPFSFNTDHEGQVLFPKRSQPGLRIFKPFAIHQEKCNTGTSVAGTAFRRNVFKAEITAPEIKGPVSLFQLPRQSDTVFHCVLTVSIGCNHSADIRQVITDPGIAGFQCHTLAMIHVMV